MFESGTQNHVLSLLFKGLTNFNGEDLKKIRLTRIPSCKTYNFIGNLEKHLLFGTKKKSAVPQPKNLTKVFLLYGGFLKWCYPTTMGFPTKNDHLGVFWGYIPPFKETSNYHFTWQISQAVRFSHHPRFGSVMLLYTLRSGASTPDRPKTKTKCGPRILKRNTFFNVGKLSFHTLVFSNIQSIFVDFFQPFIFSGV